MHSSSSNRPSRESASSAIHALADEVRILPAYVDMTGGNVHTSDETRVALLAAMGYDASTEAAARRELDRFEFINRHRLIDRTAVLPADDRDIRTLRVLLPPGVHRRTASFHVTLTPEGGESTTKDTPVAHSRGGSVWLRLPQDLEHGYHEIQLSVCTPGRDYSAVQRRIVHPKRCVTVASLLAGKRGFGIWANLYTVRNRRNFGVGDLTDLGRLTEWASSSGADFVGINPLHSLRNRGEQISPYYPNSRLYGNEIYLDLTAVPEFQSSEDAKAVVAAAEANGELPRLRATSHVYYEAIANLKLSVLRPLYETIKRGSGSRRSSRWREFSDYKRDEGKSLIDYATFRALEEHSQKEGRTTNWMEWPEKYRRPDTSSVAEFRLAHEREIDFHCYVQFELDRQLGAAGRLARSTMAVGLYGDLALGSDPGGADAWAYQGVFVAGARLGAPPDDFAADGQDWGLPPISPEALRASGYDFWIRLLRANLRHAGALRVDHAMGLVRQFWIPVDLPASRGAYVGFPSRDLLGILALESTRNDAVIIGEDLGTVPSGLQSLLARWGILSSRVLYFERKRDGSFRRPNAYSKRAMVTANTHDLVPLAGYWKGRDHQLRRDAGAYSDSDAYAEAQRRRQNEQASLRELLRSTIVQNGTRPEGEAAALTRAAYAFLAKTPAPLIGVSLDDLGLEEEPVNLPGISNDRFPSWSRKMKMSVEDLFQDLHVEETLQVLAAGRSP